MPTSTRKAHAVDQTLKEANLKRLRRIEGQIRGIAKMVEDEKYCADIIVQIASVQEALRGVGRNLMKNHLEHCIHHSGDYEEVLDLVYRHLR